MHSFYRVAKQSTQAAKSGVLTIEHPSLPPGKLSGFVSLTDPISRRLLKPPFSGTHYARESCDGI